MVSCKALKGVNLGRAYRNTHINREMDLKGKLNGEVLHIAVKSYIITTNKGDFRTISIQFNYIFGLN